MNPPDLTQTLYNVSLILAALAAPFSMVRPHKTGLILGMVILVGVVAAWLSRLISAGHIPMFGAYESALSLAFFSGIILLAFSLMTGTPYLWIFPPAVALLLYHGSRYSPLIYALTISERGFWVHFHAIVAFLSFGLALAVASASCLVLFSHKIHLRKPLLLFYLCYTATIATGSFYEFLLFGKPWSFDPIESMNLACFLIFTTLLHISSFQNWEPRRTAPWALFCFLLLVLGYRLILIFPPESTYHIFDIDLRIHLVR